MAAVLDGFGPVTDSCWEVPFLERFELAARSASYSGAAAVIAVASAHQPAVISASDIPRASRW